MRILHRKVLSLARYIDNLTIIYTVAHKVRYLIPAAVEYRDTTP